MSVLAYLIWPIYLICALVIFWFSSQIERSSRERAELYSLGCSLMMLAVGRMLFAIDPDDLPSYRWIFDLAHCAMFIFVGLKIRNAWARIQSPPEIEQ